MHFNNILGGFEHIVDWVVLTAVVVAAITLAGNILVMVRDKKMLSKEHESLKEGQGGLSKEHGDIKGIISKSGEKIEAIDRRLITEAVRRESLDKNLTDDQRDIRRQIDAIKALEHEMVRLQSEVLNLKSKNEILLEQNNQLVGIIAGKNRAAKSISKPIRERQKGGEAR